MSSASRATLRTRPRLQRTLIRYWEYIPAVRITALILRMLAVLVLAVEGIALLSISNVWGLPILALAVFDWLVAHVLPAGQDPARW